VVEVFRYRDIDFGAGGAVDFKVGTTDHHAFHIEDQHGVAAGRSGLDGNRPAIADADGAWGLDGFAVDAHSRNPLFRAALDFSIGDEHRGRLEYLVDVAQIARDEVLIASLRRHADDDGWLPCGVVKAGPVPSKRFVAEIGDLDEVQLETLAGSVAFPDRGDQVLPIRPGVEGRSCRAALEKE